MKAYTLATPSSVSVAYAKGLVAGSKPWDGMKNPYSLFNEHPLFSAWREGFKDGMAIDLGIKNDRDLPRRGGNLDTYA